MLQVEAQQRAFGGTQWVFSHEAPSVGGRMTFALYEPPQVAQGPVPALLWLSGLTCNHENFMTKAGAQRLAAEVGIALVMPDTSPRGEGVPDDPDGSYDFGLGAGFYLNATVPPYAAHYRMQDYLERDLLSALASRDGLDLARLGISGHSMGGHGALTMALRSPARFRSVSAFAPITHPSRCPWGRKALTGYLGEDSDAWVPYDAVRLIETGARLPDLLVDQGTADSFLEEQLQPHALADACAAAGIDLTLRLQPGYDHSYFFIATFIDDHLRWHATRLAA